MSALDLVEEFRSLDEVTRGVNVDNFSAGEHNSIGGVDLSGILTLDEDDDGSNDGVDGYAGSYNGAIKDSATTTTAAVTLSRASASFLDGGIGIGVDNSRSAASGWRLAGGVQQQQQQQQQQQGRESEREAIESEAWDSGEDNTSAVDAEGPGFRRYNAIPGEGGRHQKSSMPTAEGFAPSTHGGAGDGSSAGSSNPNVSSPKRPAEEGYDWDGEAGPSSDDFESEMNRRQPSPSSCELPWSKAAALEVDRGYRAAGTGSVDNPSAELSPPHLLPAAERANSSASELGEGGSRAAPAIDDKAKALARVCSMALPSRQEHYRRQPSQSRRSSEEYRGVQAEQLTTVIAEGKPERQRASRDDDPNRSRSCSDSDEAGTQEMFPATVVETGAGAEAGEAATVEALRVELSTLRDYFIRSERRREAELRELGSRLEAQERRSGRSPASGGRARHQTTPATRAQPGVGSAQVDLGVEKSRRCPDTGSGSGTPQGVVAVRNPFAGTEGGAATTPRDHFPAFEDALLDSGDQDDAAARGNGGGERCGEQQQGQGDGEGEGEDSEKDNNYVCQNEAFDFSIDTLSHINNHTDFGTDAPGASTAPPAATASTSPIIGRDGKTVRGQREKGRLPWVLVEPPAPDAGGRLQGGGQGGAEEIFDAKDTAAEEAYFSDAYATASLQTPVKHMLATAVSDLGGGGGAARRGAPSAHASTPARHSRPAVPSFRGEHQEHYNGSVGPHPNGGRASLQSCGDRASSLSDPQSPAELCMADVFARASAELGGGVRNCEDGGGRGLQVGRGAAVVGGQSGEVFQPAEEEEQKASVGVDVACQTTLSFSAHDEVRFVSVPARAPLSTRMADGRTCRRRTDDNSESRRDGVGYRFEGNLEADSGSAVALGPAASIPSRGSCFTPRQSRPPRCETPNRRPQRSGGGELLLPAERARTISETTSFCNSPDLSPIPVARTRLDGSAADGGALTAGARNGGASDNDCDWREDEESQEACVRRVPRTSVSARRQQGVGRGLSPIFSDGGGSASSAGAEGHRAFEGQRADDGGFVGNSSRASSKTGAGLTMGPDDGGGGGGGNDRPTPVETSGGAPAVPRATRVIINRSLASSSGPLLMDSSADVTRSSVLRASTTLETMAPLDDTGPSFSYSSRTGVSFAGELFADSRLRASAGAAERAPRYDFFIPPREEKLRRSGGGGGGGGGLENVLLPPGFLQQRFPQQERPWRSAPTLASEWSTHSSSRFEAERLAAGMTGHATSLGPSGVPPAVVGAWLAAAIEEMYTHNASGSGGDGGRSDFDQRVGTKRDQGSGGRDGLPAHDPTAAARVPLANASQAPPARAHQTRAPAYAAGPGDSPPPPPPPPERPLHGEHEEEIFYQRQRLLQRVVSAAASHGGVMPSLSSVRDVCTEAGQGQNQEEEQEETETRSSKRGDDSWRRHSDPLAWKMPSVAAAAATRIFAGEGGETEVAGAAAGSGGWPVSGTPAAAYMRRHTSGYWRDRLGMTTH
ncbi:unnamed protein product [Pylaiella littoralis]